MSIQSQPPRVVPRWRWPVFVVLAGLAVSAQGEAPGGVAQGTFTVPHLPAQLVVSPAAGVDDTGIVDALAPFGATVIASSARNGLRIVAIASDTDLAAAVALAAADPRIDFAQPNYLFEPLAIPNDPSFAQQWSKDNQGFNAPDGLGNPGADMNLVAAWDSVTDASAVKLAIIDDSVDTSHPDLAANLLATGKCFASPSSSRPCVNGENDPNPSHPDDFHGTLVTGSAAARGDNATGIAGAAWRVSVLPIKVDLSSYAIVEAIDEAIAQGAHIVNMSFGGPVQGQAQREAFDRAEAAGVLLIAAAGNSDSDTDLSRAQYPSNSDHPNMLSVAATTSRDKVASFSNFGASTVDVAAPGSLVLTTQQGGGYASASGTSFAAPHAAGVAALVRAHTGTQDYAQLRAHLMAGGVDGMGTLGPVTPGQDETDIPGRTGSGRLDAALALAGPDAGVLRIDRWVVDDSVSGNGNGALDPGETATLIVAVRNEWTGETAVTATLQSASADLVVNTIDAVTLGDIPQGQTRNAAFLVSVAPGLTGFSNAFLTLSLNSDQRANPHDVHLWLPLGALEPGASVTQQIQRWDWDEFHGYHIDVPAGALSLEVSLSAPSGDVDLLLRQGERPEYLITLDAANKTTGGFYYVDGATRVSAQPGAVETLLVNNPAPGLWHAVVVNYDQAAKSYTLGASVDSGGIGAGEIAFDTDQFSIDETAGIATIGVTRSGPATAAAFVDYATADGTATAGSDYSAASGTLVWAIGETGTKTFSVPVTDDASAEGIETVLLSLANASGATLGAPSAATLSIVDDETASAAFLSASASIGEGTGPVTAQVQRTGSTAGELSIDWTTRDGSAVAGADYLAASDTLTWADGDDTAKTIVVTVIDDEATEGSETFAIDLTGNSAAAPSTLTVTINDNDTNVTRSGGGGAAAALVALLAVFALRRRKTGRL